MADQQTIEISVEDVQNLRRMHAQQYKRLMDAYIARDRPAAQAAAKEIADSHIACADMLDVVEYMLTHWTPPAPPRQQPEERRPMTLTPEQRERIETAYCDANMKCDDDTGLYDVQPGCQARKVAAQAFLAVTGTGMLLDALAASEAARAAAEEQLAEARSISDRVYRAVGSMLPERLEAVNYRLHAQAYVAIRELDDVLRAAVAEEAAP